MRHLHPGQIVAATALLAAHPRPTTEQVRHWMMGNLCRCTGYYKIVESILAAGRVRHGSRSPARRHPHRRMKPFQLHQPEYQADALALLDQCNQRGDDVQLMAGGTSLVLLMNLGLVEPTHIIGLRV